MTKHSRPYPKQAQAPSSPQGNTITPSTTGHRLHRERLAVIESMIRHGMTPTPGLVDTVARIILNLERNTHGPH